MRLCGRARPAAQFRGFSAGAGIAALAGARFAPIASSRILIASWEIPTDVLGEPVADSGMWNAAPFKAVHRPQRNLRHSG